MLVPGFHIDLTGDLSVLDFGYDVFEYALSIR